MSKAEPHDAELPVDEPPETGRSSEPLESLKPSDNPQSAIHNLQSEARNPQSPTLGDLPADEFRAHLHRVADWIADYRERIAERRITPLVQPGEIASALPESPPESPESIHEILKDLDQLIVPGLVHWGHPAFLGYFGSTTNAPGILGEMIAAALNVSAMTWRTSPAATELETVVLGWLRQLLGLPQTFTGVVYDTASVAIMHALAAAREATGLRVREHGLSGRAGVPRLRIYASDQAHSSIEKAAITLGLGESNVVRVASDDEYRMNVAALRAAIDEDRGRGFLPMAVVATVGTTSATSIDPVPDIAAVCLDYKIWLHVDAAYGGAMALLPEGRWAMKGVEQADSIVVNPHKWLFVPLDFSALYTRHPEMLRAVFSLVPEYLRGDADHAGVNYMDYGIQLGRRFRALKAWMVFRTFGRAGLTARIREHLRLAQLFASWVDADEEFERLAPVTMGVICFRARPQNLSDDNVGQPSSLDQFNHALLEAINATGKAYLTQTQLRGRVALRLAVGNILTTEYHLRQVWELIRNEARGRFTG